MTSPIDYKQNTPFFKEVSYELVFHNTSGRYVTDKHAVKVTKIQT